MLINASSFLCRGYDNDMLAIFTGGERRNEEVQDTMIQKGVDALCSGCLCMITTCIHSPHWPCARGDDLQFLPSFPFTRVAVVGNVDAGKSTLLGVLTHGELDNGRGFARQKLFRHKHEMESGRTSSVGNDILGFDACGNVVNKPDHGHLDWIKICEDAAKVCPRVCASLLWGGGGGSGSYDM